MNTQTKKLVDAVSYLAHAVEIVASNVSGTDRARFKIHDCRSELQRLNDSIDTSTEQDQEQRFLVWSNEHGAWWRSKRNGYTKIRSDAGRYTLLEACKILEAANRHVADDVHPNETMVPE